MYLLLTENLKDGVFNLFGVVEEFHVSQHHDGGEEEGGGVGLVLTRDIGSGSVDL